eukprot:2029766-Rhodomonas_salina.1
MPACQHGLDRCRSSCSSLSVTALTSLRRNLLGLSTCRRATLPSTDQVRSAGAQPAADPPLLLLPARAHSLRPAPCSHPTDV